MTADLRLPPPWRAVKRLFDAWVDLPPADRDAALRAADVDPLLANEVRQLLAQHEAEEQAGGGFLAAPPEWPATPDEDRQGQRLGPWELGTRLGSGGMGEVWAARRADGAYDARVAVKLLRGGPATTTLLEKFAQEQRLLARLNHAHIARLLDAGHTDDGRPYFVMEAVDGQPIDAACRGQPLATRLRLFQQLADAVAHAHRQQLIHRDLKPANVLVTPDGQVKLLDFGIAQALDLAPEAADAPRALTPVYASPEQVRGEPGSAATDVYSLGVLLHVLLTGSRPYGRGATTAQEAAQAVLLEAATPPSATPPDPTGRSGDAGVERKRLAGDLDAIVRKALAKTPGERYASVEALAADLRAHSEGLPVSARSHSPVYLAGKFMRRHRGVVLASLLALLALVAALAATAWHAKDAAAALALAALALGLGISTWQARLAAQARDEARGRLAQTNSLVRDIVMRYADTVTFLPGGLQMKADLLKDTLAYLERLATGAGGDAELAGERAKAHTRLADMMLPGIDATLDQPDEAQRHGELALALFPAGEPAHRDDPSFYMWWARALRVRERGQRVAGDPGGALRTLERRAGVLQTALRRFPAAYDLRFELGSNFIGIGQAWDTWMETSLNRPDKALEAFASAEQAYLLLQQQKPTDGDVPYQLGTVAGGQMIVLHKQGRLPEALAHGRRAVAWREAALALQPEHTAYRDGLAGESNNLCDLLLKAGLNEEALAVSARGEAVMRALEADDPTLATWATRRRHFALHRGRALRACGQPGPALERLQDALPVMVDATPGPMLRRRGLCQLEMAMALQALDRVDEARAACAAALEDLDRCHAVGAGESNTAVLLAQAQALQAVLLKA